jgi:glutathione S-transferase
MIFYDCMTAPSPRRARIFIAEKGLQIETVEISILKGEQLLPDFLAINPRATVPVLITDTGQTLTENIAIATYLEALHPTPPLLGTTPDEKAAVMMWNAIAEQQGGLPIAEVLRNANPHMQGRAIPGPTNFDQIPELATRGHARVALFFDLLEKRLGKTPNLAGDFYSMADITAFVLIQFARVIKASIPPGNTATQVWFERIKSRPSSTL